MSTCTSNSLCSCKHKPQNIQKVDFACAGTFNALGKTREKGRGEVKTLAPDHGDCNSLFDSEKYFPHGDHRHTTKQ